MSQTLADPYRLALTHLAGLGVPYACIGTAGLALHKRLPPDYVLHDVDIVLHAEAAGLPDFAAWLQRNRWQLSLWDVPCDALPVPTRLLEHFYLRARRETHCLDLVFSGLPLSIADILAGAVTLDGLRVATLDDIVLMKRRRGREADIALLYWLSDREARF